MNIVSKAEFSRIAGVCASAVSRACEAGLKPALVEGKIDADHPAAKAYISRCGKPGRPRGGDKSEIANFVILNSRENERLTPYASSKQADLIEQISANITYISFNAKLLKKGERMARMNFVTCGIQQLKYQLAI